MFEVSPVLRFAMDTTDPEQGHQWLRDTYVEHEPRIRGDRSEFRMRVAGAVTDLFRVDELVHTMSVEADSEPVGALFVSRLRGGGISLQGTAGGLQRGPGELAMLDPLGPIRSGWEMLDAQIVVLDLAATRTIAEEMTGLPAAQVRFGLSGPIDHVRTQYWTKTVDHLVAQVLADDEVTAQPLIRAEAFRGLALATLTTFPNSAMTALAERPAPRTLRAEPAVLRRAMAFIEDNAHRPIGLAEIAESARVGARGLQLVFRRHQDRTPLEYLMEVRIERAHRDLEAGDPTRGDTVAATAARWGFTNPGRFSVQYRERFGCSPSKTLRS